MWYWLIKYSSIRLLTAKPMVLCFYSETSFWPSYCQISTILDKILHIPIVVRNTLVGRLRPWLTHGWLQSRPNQNDNFFSVILVTHPKSYIEMTDRRDFGGEDGCYREKFLNFVAWVEPDQKQHFLRFRASTVLHTAYRKQFYPKPMVPMESRDSEGVPFASLESLWPGIWQI